MDCSKIEFIYKSIKSTINSGLQQYFNEDMWQFSKAKGWTDIGHRQRFGCDNSWLQAEKNDKDHG